MAGAGRLLAAGGAVPAHAQERAGPANCSEHSPPLSSCGWILTSRLYRLSCFTKSCVRLNVGFRLALVPSFSVLDGDFFLGKSVS